VSSVSFLLCYRGERLLGTGKDEQYRALGRVKGGEAREFNEEKCCNNEVGQQRVS
jgi:hypothetical protein